MSPNAGNLGRACKVAVDLDTGDHAILGYGARGWGDAEAIVVPDSYTRDGWVTFVTVEGMVAELVSDTFEMGRFEEPRPYHPGDETL